jgi:hypothetical protein|tara:strand:+ start:6852 stop:7148 length:297 start_codon:yes stop_codon:yes gene_type:complete
MPLIPPILNTALTSAFSAAMYDFITVSAQPGTNDGVDKSALAISTASATFASIAGPAIDAYIRSQLIILPPGQAVATAGSPSAQVGATTAPSPPAIIT